MKAHPQANLSKTGPSEGIFWRWVHRYMTPSQSQATGLHLHDPNSATGGIVSTSSSKQCKTLKCRNYQPTTKTIMKGYTIMSR
jgi:hypothetical protein